jgi:hypothetical protein
LFGFVPHDSLVLVPIVAQSDAPPALGPAMRVDLAAAEQDPASGIKHWLTQLSDLPVLAVTGIVVCHRTEKQDSLPVCSTVDTIIEILRQRGVPSLEVIHLPEFAVGARWRSYVHVDRTGILPDPTTTVAAAANTVAGFTVAASREDLAARYTPAGDADRDRLRPLIAAAIRQAEDDQSEPAAARDRIARADAAVRASECGVLPDDDSVIADLAATFTTLEFRDAMLVEADNEPSVGAERLALHLWRLTPEPAASHLIAIIAVHAYRHGDGAGARIALDAARTGTPLVGMLSACFARGIDPALFSQLMHEASQETRKHLTTGARRSDA